MPDEPRESEREVDFSGASLPKIIVFLGIAYFYKITSLGTVLHEFSHQLAVGWRGYRVYEVDYFSHVRHDMPTSLIDALFISYAPLIVNTAVSISLIFLTFGEVPTTVGSLVPSSARDAAFVVICMFLVVSFLFHAVPSLEDIENIKSLVSMRLKWYRVDLMIAFTLLSPLFVPTYMGLLASRKTGTRVLVDMGFTAVVLLSVFGVVPWWEWIPQIHWERLAKELLVRVVEIVQKKV